MAGHWHDPSAATQNQGNQLGSRPCVRQSQLFRQNESGNTMKSLLGSSHLQWDTKHTQGAYDRPARLRRLGPLRLPDVRSREVPLRAAASNCLFDAWSRAMALTRAQIELTFLFARRFSNRRRDESPCAERLRLHAAPRHSLKHAGANEMTNPFPVPHKKEWADLGPYRAQVNAATRASEAAMAKKGRKGGKPKLFARSTDLSRDRRAQKRAAGKRSSRVGLREPELRSVLSGAGDEELLEATLSKYSVADDAEEGNAVMAQWRDDRSLMCSWLRRVARIDADGGDGRVSRGGVDAALASLFEPALSA